MSKVTVIYGDCPSADTVPITFKFSCQGQIELRLAVRPAYTQTQTWWIYYDCTTCQFLVSPGNDWTSLLSKLMSDEISGKSHLQVIDELREELATVKALRAAAVSQEELNRTEANRLRTELARAQAACAVKDEAIRRAGGLGDCRPPRPTRRLAECFGRVLCTMAENVAGLRVWMNG